MQFFLLLAFVVFSISARAESSCRDRIKDVVCLAEPAAEGETPETRRCRSAPEYAHFFEAVYDKYPSYLQKMFCHLEKIFIEKEWKGSAYAGIFYSRSKPNSPRSGFIGIRRQLLDTASSAADWASWKEQVSFGTDSDYVNVQPGLPVVETTLGDQGDLLFFAVTHELGHIFDYANKLNQYDKCAGPYGDLKGDCTARKDSWAALSWQSNQAPFVVNEFPLRKRNCSYFCNGKFLDSSEQDELYDQLKMTTFLTPYASRAPTEDFAETFAFYHVWKLWQRQYRIRTASGKSFDVIGKLQSKEFEAKRIYLERLLASPLRYPSE